jgi:hypothetical protein
MMLPQRLVKHVKSVAHYTATVQSQCLTCLVEL